MGVDCHPNATCNPIRGCLCKDGFQGDGLNCKGKESIQYRRQSPSSHIMTKCSEKRGMRLRITTAVINCSLSMTAHFISKFMLADQQSSLNIVHCSLKVVLSPQTKTSVALLEVRVTLTQTASTRMVPFSVNAMQDLLATDSVAKEVGSV